MRAQPQPLRPAGRAGAGQVGRLDALRGAGAGAVPGHHRGAVHRSPCRPTGSCGSTWHPRRGRSRNDGRARPGPAHADRGVAGAAPGRAGGRHRRSSAPRCCGPAARASSTSSPSVGEPTGPHRRGPARRGRRAALPALRARRRRSACSTTRTAWPCAPTRCATRSWRRCCWPRCAASSRARARWPSCATTTTPRCSTAATGATSWSSRGSAAGPAARRRPHGRAGRGGLQPRGRPAGALGLGGTATSAWSRSRWPTAPAGGRWP